MRVVGHNLQVSRVVQIHKPSSCRAYVEAGDKIARRQSRRAAQRAIHLSGGQQQHGRPSVNECFLFHPSSDIDSIVISGLTTSTVGLTLRDNFAAADSCEYLALPIPCPQHAVCVSRTWCGHRHSARVLPRGLWKREGNNRTHQGFQNASLLLFVNSPSCSVRVVILQISVADVPAAAAGNLVTGALTAILARFKNL